MSRPLLPADQNNTQPPAPAQSNADVAAAIAALPPLPGAPIPPPIAHSSPPTPPPPPTPTATTKPPEAPLLSNSPLAEAFPQWDLMPPAEFIKRARR